MKDLKETNWNTVICSENVNIMYDTFSEKLTNIYNKNCPIVNEKVKNKRTDKPWMTKSLINACKKKKYRGNSVRSETNGPKFQNHPISTYKWVCLKGKCV